MTRDELLAELRRVKENDHDPELAHNDADELLLLFIDDAEIRAAFEAIKKWYA